MLWFELILPVHEVHQIVSGTTLIAISNQTISQPNASTNDNDDDVIVGAIKCDDRAHATHATHSD